MKPATIENATILAYFEQKIMGNDINIFLYTEAINGQIKLWESIKSQN